MATGDGAVRVPTEAELMGAVADKMQEFLDDPNHPDLVGHPDGNPVTIRPAFPTATDLANRWAEGVNRNSDRWLHGIQNPRANFKDAAVAKKGAWAGGVQAAVQGDYYAKGMNKVDVNLAIETAVAVGAQGFAQGAQLRKPKLEAVMKDVAPAMAAAVATVRAMPANSDAEREARAVAMIRAARGIGQARRKA